MYILCVKVSETVSLSLMDEVDLRVVYEYKLYK